jgi:superfamily I DNA/RNA helicase/RecB family exonuclease
MPTSEAVRNLDSYQQAAVDHGDGPAIVLAGPGSGKTRVIVERAVRLIDEELARPDELLVLTFSRKAASDLRQRLADQLRRSYASFPVTTFHAFCFALLSRNAAEPPRMARPAERQIAIRAALAAENHLGLNPSRTLAAEALAFCSLCDEYLDVPEHPLAAVRARYVQQLGALDYGGLQREAVALLQENEAVRRAYVDGFRYVLVDEYQDTNVAQETLLELIAGTHRNVFCVADEDQSIYGFRGAEIENTLRFEERWPGAARYDLPTNYRSAPRIVELGTSVVRRNVDTHRDKPLTAADERTAELRGRTFRHPSEETDWIAREVAALRLDEVPLGEIAVLGRSLKEIGPRIAYALRRHEIPFHAPLAPPLHPTADALLGVLELSLPERWEEEHEPLALRTLASPLFDSDPLELREFRRAERTLYGALRDSGRFDQFFEALAIVKRQRSAGAAVYALWDRLAYFRDLQWRCRPLDAPREDTEELAALTVLSDAANEFEGGIGSFTEDYRSGVLADEEWLPASALPTDAVALLTVHQAKGLEWEAVFVAGLVEGRFPALSRSQHALFDREDFSRRSLGEAERARRALEEERRLFYVALTRARTRLYLTATEESREETGRSLSRFFLEAQGHLDPERDRTGFVSVEEALAALRRAGGGPPGWRERDEPANGNPMLPEGGIWTSATRLAPYENCPLQFFFGSLLEIGRARTPAMSLGGIFHDVLETFHDPERGEPQTLERLLELGEEHWSDEGMRPAALAAQNRRLLDTMLRSYFESEVARSRVGDVLAVERRFRFDLDASKVSGYIDRIDRLSTGRLRLVDYKTSKWAMRLEEAEQDLQLALYALACRELPELAELGDVAEIVYLYPRIVLASGISRRSQTVTPDLADRTRERVRTNIAAVVDERFDFAPTADCQWCEFKRICPRHFGGDAPL